MDYVQHNNLDGLNSVIQQWLSMPSCRVSPDHEIEELKDEWARLCSMVNAAGVDERRELVWTMCVVLAIVGAAPTYKSDAGVASKILTSQWRCLMEQLSLEIEGDLTVLQGFSGMQFYQLICLFAQVCTFARTLGEASNACHERSISMGSSLGDGTSPPGDFLVAWQPYPPG